GPHSLRWSDPSRPVHRCPLTGAPRRPTQAPRRAGPFSRELRSELQPGATWRGFQSAAPPPWPRAVGLLLSVIAVLSFPCFALSAQLSCGSSPFSVALPLRALPFPSISAELWGRLPCSLQPTRAFSCRYKR